MAKSATAFNKAEQLKKLNKKRGQQYEQYPDSCSSAKNYE